MLMSPTTSGGRYASYKCATARLLAWLTEKEPPTPRTVRAMLNAARRLSERCEMMPADVKASLELAIKLRREVHELYTSRVAQTNPDDERHAHFISALERVRAWLQPPSSKEERRDAPTKQLEPEAEELANRFELLDVEEGWDEVDESVPKSQMLVGKDVLIDGLTSKPELNGRTGYVVEHLSHNGRYKVRCGDEFYSLKPENIKHAPMQEAEQEQFILGEAIEFEAACLMLDVQAALGEVATAWNDYKNGRISLLTAAALTNACVSHAEHLASALEAKHPRLMSLSRVVCVAHLSRAIKTTMSQLNVKFGVALDIVCDVAFGDASDRIVRQFLNARTINGTAIFLIEQALESYPCSSQKDEMELEKMSQKLIMRRATQCTKEQARAVMSMIAKEVVLRFAPVSYGEDEVNDFYLGENGILFTSDFLQKLCAAGLVRRPRTWSAPKTGFFGEPWDEVRNPAESTEDLLDYMGGLVPALFYFADAELRTKHGSVEFPELRHATLMPLSNVLKKAMDRGTVSLAFVVSIQAALLSLVCVNGERRCKRVHITTKAAFAKAAQQLGGALAALEGESFRGRHTEISTRNVQMFKAWVDHVHALQTSPPPVGTHVPEILAIAERQRDQALLENPWVAGQYLLVLCLGVGMGGGVISIDDFGQTSFVLHVGNALRTVGALGESDSAQLLEMLTHTFDEDCKSIWFAGVPRNNFSKHWFHRMGMDVTLMKNRKLTSIEAEDISLAFKRAAAADFADLALMGSADPLQVILQAIREAFEEDPLVGINLGAVGAQLLPLAQHLVNELGLQDEVVANLVQLGQDMERSSGTRKKGRHRENNDSAGPDRRHALYLTIIGALFMKCERDAPESSDPLHLGRNPDGGAPTMRAIDRDTLPPCSPLERAYLKRAGAVLVAFIQNIKATNYRLLTL